MVPSVNRVRATVTTDRSASDGMPNSNHAQSKVCPTFEAIQRNVRNEIGSPGSWKRAVNGPHIPSQPKSPTPLITYIK